MGQVNINGCCTVHNN